MFIVFGNTYAGPGFAVSSITSNQSGTITKIVGELVSGQPTGQTYLYKVAAPAAAVHTITVTWTSSFTGRWSATVFSGCDQTDPAPNADAVTFNGTATTATLTPANIVSGDGGYIGCTSNGLQFASSGPNQLNAQNSGGYPVAADAYILGPGSLTATMVSNSNTQGCIAAHIKAAAGGGGGGGTTLQIISNILQKNISNVLIKK
jgi:hypothetical protein